MSDPQWVTTRTLSSTANCVCAGTSFTIDVHHHILPAVFWRATNDAHIPCGDNAGGPTQPEVILARHGAKFTHQLGAVV